MAADITTTPSTPEALAATFREELGERVLDAQVAYDQLTITVPADALAQVARFCKDEMGMTFFDFLSAVDDREEGFSLVVRVYSHVRRTAVIIRTAVPGGRDEPRIATLTGVYAGANWHERETYDMFGIVFEGHPGLLPRILTVENFEGWPLRKEFRLASRDVKPWPGAKEPGGEDESGDAPAAKSPAPGADPEDRAAAAKAKAERAKAKAAEARARKAAEKAAAMEGDPVPPSEPEAPSAEAGADGGDAEPGSPREAQGAAAGQPVPEGTPDPTTPEGAAEIAGTADAKDAAAGARDGDTATPAPGDPVAGDQPVDDPAGEASKAEGGDPADQSPPGVQPEGTHDLDAADSTARPSAPDAEQEAEDDE